MADYAQALDVRIKHARYDAVLNRLEERLSIVSSGEGTIIPLLGPTRCGKSELILDVANRLGSQSTGPGSMIATPDFCVGKIPPKPNDGDLYRAMLKAVGHRSGSKEKTGLVRDRLIEAIAANGIKVIALDEVSHCAERGANLSARAAGDHFKTVVDDTGVVLLLSGLPRFQALIDQNEQFRDRATRTIYFLPYDWNVEEDREAFVASVLAAFALLQKEGAQLDFDDLEMSRRLYGATGGRVGQMLRLLKLAARRMNRNTLVFTDIAVAAEATVQQTLNAHLFFEDEPPDDLALTRARVLIMSECGLPTSPKNLNEFAVHVAA